ncbi:hypothetical protein KGF56_003704 [Candida oxycetoniae]|uniref:Cytochrome b5 heme-binding domain-containing protein n=1 Tax=Candida oxycetoniae TaxID=497107 RepID=A0AAI9SVS4_9ASCO|nr:uncharacterized protein KGF56_003704 [Candida oxycetoniae]KAI3403420.2 hypothetical protein KGF56_003704 [Candida oxycetoniae]
MSGESRRASYISLKEVKRHDKPTDLWIILYNKVYDVTDFTKEHIGGIEVLHDCGGADATEAFEDVGHSDFAVDLLQPFFVADVMPSECRSYRSTLFMEEQKGLIKEKNRSNDKSLLSNFVRVFNFRFNEWISIFWLACLAIGSFVLLIIIQGLK